MLLTARQEPPVFTRPLEDKDVREQTRARFDATVKGEPEPEITWYVTAYTFFTDLYWVSCSIVLE